VLETIILTTLCATTSIETG